MGDVEASGLTASQFAARIREPLAQDYFVNPQVTAVITEYHSLRYYVSGSVRQPGLYEMTAATTLLELIAKAGGVLPERGHLAYIFRAATNKDAAAADKEDITIGKDPLIVDLQLLLDRGDMSNNQRLNSGDVVHIPMANELNLGESKIYVEGKVTKPGVYPFQLGITALNAGSLVGGFDRFAAPNRTRIIRQTAGKPEVININLDEVKKGVVKDVELRPGDLIQVPESWL